MVIFPKISLKSFIHDLTQTLYFLNNRTKEIFGKYIVDRIFPYQVLTDTDSMLLFIIFIWKPESSIPNSNFRDLLFEAYINNEITDLILLTNFGANLMLEINLLKETWLLLN